MEKRLEPLPETQTPPSKEELFSLRSVMEGLSNIELQAHKNKMLSGISDRETIVNLINDVMDGRGIE